jgi:hypothetical protein
MPVRRQSVPSFGGAAVVGCTVFDKYGHVESARGRHSGLETPIFLERTERRSGGVGYEDVQNPDERIAVGRSSSGRERKYCAVSSA